MPAGGFDDVNDVVLDVGVHVDLLQSCLHPQQQGQIHHLSKLRLVRPAKLASVQHLSLLFPARVADPDPDQKAVQLRLGQRVCALVLDWVLGGQDQEGSRQRPGDPLHRHLALLHPLQQRRLGLGGRAVDLVRQYEIGKDRPLTHLEIPGALIEDGGAGDVRGHEVGGELDPGEAQAAAPGEGSRHQGLGQSGEVLDQNVAVGEDGQQDQFQDLPLAHNRLLNLVDQAVGRLLQLGRDTHRPKASRESRIAANSFSRGPLRGKPKTSGRSGSSRALNSGPSTAMALSGSRLREMPRIISLSAAISLSRGMTWSSYWRRLARLTRTASWSCSSSGGMEELSMGAAFRRAGTKSGLWRSSWTRVKMTNAPTAST